MAALSVESGREGKYTGNPSCCLLFEGLAQFLIGRNSAGDEQRRDIASPAAARVFPTRSSTIARWKDATRSSVSLSQLAR